MARTKIEIPATILTTIDVPVRISDINYGNHVGNDAFVSLIHEARMQWLQQNQFTELDIDGTGVIMSDLAMEFKAQSFYGEEISISISAGETSRFSFELYYLLTTQRNNETVLLAKAKTGMVCFDYRLNKISPVPEKLWKILQPS